MTTAEVGDQLELLEFEDQRVDRIVVKFNGGFELNLNDPKDRAYFDRLRLGRRVAVHATGKVTARPFSLNDAKGVVTTAATVTIDADLPDAWVDTEITFSRPAYDPDTGEIVDNDEPEGFDPDNPGDAPDDDVVPEAEDEWGGEGPPEAA